MDITATTINVCAITAAPKLDALRCFLHANKLDVVFLQEVAVPAFNFPGYSEVVNIGEQRRGTAILVRDQLAMSDPVLLPSGRATSVKVGHLTCVNLYAPSGSRQRTERAEFFAHDVTPVLAAAGEHIIMAGDFNCVLRDQDTTGKTPKCPELAAVIHDLRLQDAWPALRQDPGHTFFAGGMSARLDRVYASPTVSVLQADTTAVPFSADHHAVTVKIKYSEQQHSRPRSTKQAKTSWTLDSRILEDPDFTAKLAEKLEGWRAMQGKYPGLAEWWVQCVKPGVRRLASDFTREMRRELNSKLRFLQDALQDLCAVSPRSATDTRLIREIKKEIIALHAQKLRGVLDRSKLDSVMEDEPVSMHHVAAMKKRARQQNIQALETVDGEVLTAQQDIARHFRDVFQQKFQCPGPSGGQHKILEEVEKTLTAADNAVLCQDFTEAEVLAAVKKSMNHKSPGEDGITAEFYKTQFETIGQDLTAVFNDMWRRRTIPEDMMKGIIVMVPKKSSARVVKDYRPITLLDVDAKLYARVLAARLTRVADKMLHENQVRPGGRRTMAGALCDLRDVISALGTHDTPGCILSVDFSGAFDNVNHEFLFQTLKCLGLDSHFVSVLQAMYAGATSRLRINGELTDPFCIGRSVRQGCPLSALLFAVVLCPLLLRLQRHLLGLQLARSCLKVSAYADDAFAVLRSNSEVTSLNLAFQEFAAASGLAVNPQKCAVLAVGSWDCTQDIGFPYVANMRVLGVEFSANIKTTIKLNWPRVLQAVKGVFISSTARNLGLSLRAEFVRTFALAKLWHVAQVLPLPANIATDIMKAVGMFVFKGHLFKVKVQQCCQPRSKGGLGIPVILLKCNALFAGRWESLLFVDPDSFSAEWLQLLLRRFGTGNPPNSGAVWAAASHFASFLTIRAYCAPPRRTAKPKAMIRELYRVQDEAAVKEPHRVEAMHPAVNWPRVWANLSSSALPVDVQEAWYVAVHDLVATNYRLFQLQDRKRRHPTGLCARCTAPDTLLHRLAECCAAPLWRWLRGPLRRLTGEPPRPSWLLRPDFSAPSEARQAAAVWLLGQSVAYLLGATAPTLGSALSVLRAEKDRVLARPGRWPTALVDGLNLPL